jgi:hypothetical protein
VVLVWYVFDAPNAGLWPNGHLTGQTLSNINYLLVPKSSTFKDFCVDVPRDCHQSDLVAYPASLVAQFPGLIAVASQLDLLAGNNILFSELTSNTGGCDPCCIRMTGGGQTDGMYTLNGDPVAMSQGFQLRTGPGAHSNLEINFADPDGSGISQFHLGPPDGYSDFKCGSVTCGVTGGGKKPQNQPNSIFGLAIGTLDGEPATVWINFVDCGEPGNNDTREIAIWHGSYLDPMGNVVPGFFDPTVNPAVIFASGVITHGNNQAHKC